MYDDDGHTQNRGEKQHSRLFGVFDGARRRHRGGGALGHTHMHTHTGDGVGRGLSIARPLDWGAYRCFGRILLDFIGQIHSDVFLYGETWPPSLFDSIFVGFCGGGALF